MSCSDSRAQAPSRALPGLNCGACGFKTCEDFVGHLTRHPGDLQRCIHQSGKSEPASQQLLIPTRANSSGCGAGCTGCPDSSTNPADAVERVTYKDSLDRDFDFLLDIFPNEPGPRETMLPHNPMLTRELEIARGDILIGRPLGMSCGCPITHCGVVMDVDARTGVIVWCVTGPLGPRSGEFKDIGYYSAEAYEGLVRDSRGELRIGSRYWFMPRRCMLQWRHSGLINFMSRTSAGTQVRIEGLLIG